MGVYRARAAATSLEQSTATRSGPWAPQQHLPGDDGRAAEDAPVPDPHHHLAMRDKRSWTGQGGPRSTRTTARRSRATTTCRDHPRPRQAVETIIADAQHDILRRAHPPP